MVSLAATRRCSMVFDHGELIHSPNTKTIGQIKAPLILTRNTQGLQIALCELSTGLISAFVATTLWVDASPDPAFYTRVLWGAVSASGLTV